MRVFTSSQSGCPRKFDFFVRWATFILRAYTVLFMLFEQFRVHTVQRFWTMKIACSKLIHKFFKTVVVNISRYSNIFAKAELFVQNNNVPFFENQHLHFLKSLRENIWKNSTKLFLFCPERKISFRINAKTKILVSILTKTDVCSEKPTKDCDLYSLTF